MQNEGKRSGSVDVGGVREGSRAGWSVRSLCMQFSNGESLKSLEQGRKVIRGSEEG